MDRGWHFIQFYLTWHPNNKSVWSIRKGDGGENQENAKSVRGMLKWYSIVEYWLVSLFSVRGSVRGMLKWYSIEEYWLVSLYSVRGMLKWYSIVEYWLVSLYSVRGMLKWYSIEEYWLVSLYSVRGMLKWYSIVEYWLVSLFSTNGHLNDIVIRWKQCIPLTIWMMYRWWREGGLIGHGGLFSVSSTRPTRSSGHVSEINPQTPETYVLLNKTQLHYPRVGYSQE